MKYQIVVSSTNMMNLLPRCLVGVDIQQYSSFAVVVVDNGSTDQDVVNFTAAFCERKGWDFIQIKDQVSELEAFMMGVNSGIMDDVIVFLHGSDRFLDGGVLFRLTDVYDDTVLMTTGGAIPCPDNPDFDYPTEVNLGNLFTARGRLLNDVVDMDTQETLEDLMNACSDYCDPSSVRFLDKAIYLETVE